MQIARLATEKDPEISNWLENIGDTIWTTLSGRELYAVDKGKGPLAGWLAESRTTDVQTPAADRKIAKTAKRKTFKNDELEDMLKEELEEVHEFSANFTLVLV